MGLDVFDKKYYYSTTEKCSEDDHASCAQLRLLSKPANLLLQMARWSPIIPIVPAQTFIYLLLSRIGRCRFLIATEDWDHFRLIPIVLFNHTR